MDHIEVQKVVATLSRWLPEDWSVTCQSSDPPRFELRSETTHGVVLQLDRGADAEAVIQAVTSDTETLRQIALSTDLPSGSNTALVLGLQAVAQAFEWDQAEVAAIGGVLTDAGLISEAFRSWMISHLPCRHSLG